MALLILLAACRRTPDEPVAIDWGPDPWAELGTTPLEPFRDLAQTPLTGGVRLRTSSRHPLGVVLLDDRAVPLDPRTWRRDERAQCIGTTRFPEYEVPEGRQGRCKETEVELQRGSWKPGSDIADLILVQDDAWLLDMEGQLWTANIDVSRGNAYDWMRLLPAATLSPGRLAWDGEALLVVEGQEVRRYTTAGDLLEQWTLGAPATDVAPDGGITTEGLRIAAGGWVVMPDGTLRTPDGESWGAGLTGPVAALGDRVWVATAEGVQAWEGGVMLAETAHPGVMDLAVTPAGEILALDAEGVQVWGDETRLTAGGDPLDVFIAAFLEKPKKEDAFLKCEAPEGEKSVAEAAELAMAQRGWLADLPATVAYGITPFAARRIAGCGFDPNFWLGPRTETGVLFHDERSCGGDVSCLGTWLLSEAGQLEQVGATATWSSGLAPLRESGDDWVGALVWAGLPRRYVFFDMSVLADVGHHTDPRAKDPWPQRLDELTTPGRAADAWTVYAEEGPVLMYAGDNRPVFNASDCAFLLRRECLVIDAGAGRDTEAEDLQALSILIFRALAMRAPGGTWSFHLPDLGQYDFVGGCTEEDGRWSGCAAADIQAWVEAVHSRYVLNGVAEWKLPSELEEP